jgi:hypothetical protein
MRNMKRAKRQAGTKKKINAKASTGPVFNVCSLLRKNAKMMGWGNDELFFFAEAIEHARTLPMRDSLTFLRGMLKLCGDTDYVAGLRQVVYALLKAGDDLDLLQIGLDPTTPETN